MTDLEIAVKRLSYLVQYHDDPRTKGLIGDISLLLMAYKELLKEKNETRRDDENRPKVLHVPV